MTTKKKTTKTTGPTPPKTYRGLNPSKKGLRTKGGRGNLSLYDSDPEGTWNPNGRTWTTHDGTHTWTQDGTSPNPNHTWTLYRHTGKDGTGTMKTIGFFRTSEDPGLYLIKTMEGEDHTLRMGKNPYGKTITYTDPNGKDKTIGTE